MIGVAGCGRMGGPMLAALQAAGFEAFGYDVRPAEEFGALAPVMLGREDFASRVETLLTVVRDIQQTEDVLFGAQNFSAAPGLKRVIVCSTLSPRWLAPLPARLPGMTLIDAPMSGAQIAAEERRLSFMLGGDPTDLDAAQPLFDAMGAHFHRMGPFGSGMQAKVLNNLLAASNTAMTRLILNWADEAGLDREKLLSLIHTSSGQNWFASGFDTIEFARDGWAEDNTIGILTKDVDSALDAAPDGADTALPRVVRDLIRTLTPDTAPSKEG